MIVNNIENYNVEESSKFDKQEFRIDPKYMNKMIWLTINQYKYKVRTPVQEIVSNARDAHREVGKYDKAIKITLPTRIEPTFKVRDYGCGLNPERMKTVFTSFGASTKSNSNDQTGGFGIGAKSPLTYTDQYNVITYVEGKVWHYAVNKNSLGGIDLTLLMQGITTEENGTEIQIPVKEGDHRKFIEAACRCTMFWDIQPEFNLAKEKLYKAINPIKLSSKVELYRDNDLSGMFESSVLAVVDGIPYELGYRDIRDLKLKGFNGTAVFKFNTGDLKILQTRESLEECDHNSNALENYGIAFNQLLEMFKQNLFSEVNTVKEFLPIYKDYFRVLSLGGRNFLDYHFYRNQVEGFKLDVTSYNYRGRYGAKVKTMKKDATRVVHFDSKSVVLLDDIRDKETYVIKNRRIKQALTQYDNVYLVQIKKGFIANYRKFYLDFKEFTYNLSDFEELKPQKKTRTVNGVKRTSKEFNIHIYNEFGYERQQWHTIDTFTAKKCVYSLKEGNTAPSLGSTMAKFIKANTDRELVYVSKTNLEYLKKQGVDFIDVDEFLSTVEIDLKDIEAYFWRNKVDGAMKKLIGEKKRVLNRSSRKALDLIKYDPLKGEDILTPQSLITNHEHYTKLLDRKYYVENKFKDEIKAISIVSSYYRDIMMDLVLSKINNRR